MHTLFFKLCVCVKCVILVRIQCSISLLHLPTEDVVVKIITLVVRMCTEGRYLVLRCTHLEGTT